MIRVLIVDDHPVVTRGITLLLQDVTDMKVVGEVHNGQEALDWLSQHKADVILVDIEMPVMDGIRCTTAICSTYPNVKVVAISIYADYPHMQSMIKAGAAGYLLKNCSQKELVLCIQKVNANGTFFSDDLTSTLLSGIQGKTIKKEDGFIPSLSRREKEILKHILDEATTAEIAEKLFISIGTVETHRHNMMNKLGVRNTAGLVRMAITHQLI